MKIEDYKLVLIHWDDAASHQQWTELKDVLKDTPVKCVSVGWLVSEDSNRYVLVASMDLQDDTELVSGHVTIPKAMVTVIKELAVKKPRKIKTPVAQS